MLRIRDKRALRERYLRDFEAQFSSSFAPQLNTKDKFDALGLEGARQEMADRMTLPPDTHTDPIPCDCGWCLVVSRMAKSLSNCARSAADVDPDFDAIAFLRPYTPPRRPSPRIALKAAPQPLIGGGLGGKLSALQSASRR